MKKQTPKKETVTKLAQKKAATKKEAPKSKKSKINITVIPHASGNHLVTESNEDGSVWKQSLEENNPLEGDE